MRNRHFALTAWIAGALIAVLSPLASAATYYVDRANSLAGDGNPGTQTRPFETISKAARIARAGDKVIVKAGTYSESVQVTNSGAPGTPITFEAAGKVVIQPPSVQGWTGAFNIVGKTDVIVRGFTLKNAYFGIKVDKDGSGGLPRRIVLERNHTVMTESSGIRVAFARDVEVDSNIVEKANYGGVHEMISVIASDGFVVNNNEVFNGDFVVNGVRVEGKEGIDVKSGSSNGRVTNNVVHDLTRLGIYLDAYASGVSNIEVSGNEVYRCKQGIALSSEGGGTLKNVLISNNITYANENYGIIVTPWLADGLRENIRIYNNTVYGNARGGINVATRNIYLLELHNNIAVNNGGSQLRATDVGLITSSQGNLVYGGATGNINFGVAMGDPKFRDASTGDFRLGYRSAAANRGVTIDEVPRDIVGRARPLGGAYDIGAFESK